MRKRQYSAEYKAKIVLEILREEDTVSEIGAREDISAKQLYNRKKEFLENASKVFVSDRVAKEAKREAEARQEEKEALEKKVGQLIIENDWLKKNLHNYLDATNRQSLVSRDDESPVKRQCELLGINRTSVYYKSVKQANEAIEQDEYIKRRINYWQDIFPNQCSCPKTGVQLH